MFQPWNMTSPKKFILGCTERDPADQQEAREILREYADVFAKDDLDLGQTSVVKT